MRLSHKAKNLKPSPTLVVSTQANQLRSQGIEILNMSLGEPDFPTPESICDAAKEAIDAGHTRYTSVAGIQPLRTKISTFLKEKWGYEYTADEILVSTGAKQCLYNAILSLIGPGDEVIIPTPYWVSYPTQVELAGGTPVFVESRVEDDFQIDPAAIESAITPYTKMLIINSPNNPTGAVYTRKTMEAIAQLVRKHDLWLLSDEIYNQLLYQGVESISPLQIDPSLKERTILINGFSKAYAMTGWRMGYMAAPRAVIKAANALQGAVTSGANTPTQHAALAALEVAPEILEHMRQTFETRLSVMHEGFSAIPELVVPQPQGAFYLMPDFSAYLGRQTPSGQIVSNTLELCSYLLNEAHVAAVPGEAFGAPGTIRFSYATDMDTIQAVIQHVSSALQALK